MRVEAPELCGGGGCCGDIGHMRRDTQTPLGQSKHQSRACTCSRSHHSN